MNKRLDALKVQSLPREPNYIRLPSTMYYDSLSTELHDDVIPICLS